MSGRAVLVTGASRGSARAVAEAFADAGRPGRRPLRPPAALAAEAAGAGCPAAGTPRSQADLADPEAVRAHGGRGRRGAWRPRRAGQQRGRLLRHPITDLATRSGRRPWRDDARRQPRRRRRTSTWCAVPHMRRSGGGRIINVSSRGAFRGEPGQPAYGASKAGLNAFGQSLARALGPARHRGRHRGAGLRGDRHGGRAPHRPGRRRDPRAEPVRPGRPRQRDRGGRALPGLARRPSGPAAPSSTSTAPPTSASARRPHQP